MTQNPEAVKKIGKCCYTCKKYIYVEEKKTMVKAKRQHT